MNYHLLKKKPKTKFAQKTCAIIEGDERYDGENPSAVLNGRILRSFFIFFGFLYGKKGLKRKMLEKDFQSSVKAEIKKRIPGSIVMKVEPYIQGMPDLLILYKNRWAMLECKRSETSSKRPNQEYYVGLLNNMSFSSFIYPGNKIEVLEALESFLTKN